MGKAQFGGQGLESRVVDGSTLTPYGRFCYQVSASSPQDIGLGRDLMSPLVSVAIVYWGTKAACVPSVAEICIGLCQRILHFGDYEHGEIEQRLARCLGASLQLQ